MLYQFYSLMDSCLKALKDFAILFTDPIYKLFLEQRGLIFLPGSTLGSYILGSQWYSTAVGTIFFNIFGDLSLIELLVPASASLIVFFCLFQLVRWVLSILP